jgi:hypothetical protein
MILSGLLFGNCGKGRRVNGEVNKPDDPDLAQVVRACEGLLSPPAEWKPFEGYPGSLALCVLDAIWSVNARYPIVRGVIQRYRNQWRFQGSPDEDGLPELLAMYDALGGVDLFIDEVGIRNRVSTQPGAMYKGEAVFRAATELHNLGVTPLSSSVSPMAHSSVAKPKTPGARFRARDQESHGAISGCSLGCRM